MQNKKFKIQAINAVEYNCYIIWRAVSLALWRIVNLKL
jgi:hypothetical protein